jgi:hypothetical protein
MKLQGYLKKEKKKILEIAYPNNSSISPVFVASMTIGIILLIILIHIGFSKTYIQFFPKFEGFLLVHHFHGMMMMGWLLMLLVQPVLILKGKIRLHKLAGRLSYVLAPLVLLSMYLVTRLRFHRLLENEGAAAAVARLSLNVPEIIFFAVLYSLAIFYRHRPALHARYMCSTAFLLIAPGLGRTLRTYLEFERNDGVTYAIGISTLIAGVIVIVDSWRTKRISPFVLVLVLKILHDILWSARFSPFWQETGSAIAKLF